MMAKLLQIIFVSFLFSQIVLSLERSGTSSYGPDITRRCRRPTISNCCRRKCAVRFTHVGNWTTRKDEPSTLSDCTNSCDEHYEKCLSNCECLAAENEIAGKLKEDCKCVINKNKMSSVENQCNAACRIARTVCISNCVFGRCHHAATSVNYGSKSLKGNCANKICLRSSSGPTCFRPGPPLDRDIAA